MGRDGEVVGVGEVGDLHPLGDASHAADVGLDDVGAASGDELFEAVFGVFVLAGGDGDVGGFGDFGQALDVIGQDGFLEPSDVVVLELAGHADGLLGVVAIVGVDVDLDIVADGFADGFEAFHVGALVLAEVLADLHFDAREAHVDVSGLLFDEPVDGVVGPAAATVAGDGVVGLSEEFVQGDAEGFAFEVPECDVEGGDGLECEAFAPKAADAPEHLGPDALGLEGGFADEDVFEIVGDEGSDGGGGVEVAEALGAFVGVDVDEDGGASGDAGLGRRDGGVLDDLAAGVEDEGGCYVGDFHGGASGGFGVVLDFIQVALVKNALSTKIQESVLKLLPYD